MDLKITVGDLECIPISNLVKYHSDNQNLAQTLTDAEKYQEGLDSLPEAERSRLLHFGNALEYVKNFKDYLDEMEINTSTDNLAQQLEKYKECILVITAENTGEDSSFSNSCGLSLEDYVYVVDNEHNQAYYPKYIGPGFACTEAIEPFPTGAIKKTAVFFLLPDEAKITTATFTGNEGIFATVTDIGTLDQPLTE